MRKLIGTLPIKSGKVFMIDPAKSPAVLLSDAAIETIENACADCPLGAAAAGGLVAVTPVTDKMCAVYGDFNDDGQLIELVIRF